MRRTSTSSQRDPRSKLKPTTFIVLPVAVLWKRVLNMVFVKSVSGKFWNPYTNTLYIPGPERSCAVDDVRMKSELILAKFT